MIVIPPIWRSLVKGSHDQPMDLRENGTAEHDSVTDDEEVLFEWFLTAWFLGVYKGDFNFLFKLRGFSSN